MCVHIYGYFIGHGYLFETRLFGYTVIALDLDIQKLFGEGKNAPRGCWQAHWPTFIEWVHFLVTESAPARLRGHLLTAFIERVDFLVTKSAPARQRGHLLTACIENIEYVSIVFMYGSN